jgi:hypothetical protein
MYTGHDAQGEASAPDAAVIEHAAYHTGIIKSDWVCTSNHLKESWKRKELLQLLMLAAVVAGTVVPAHCPAHVSTIAAGCHLAAAASPIWRRMQRAVTSSNRKVQVHWGDQNVLA